MFATSIRCMECGREYGLNEIVYTCLDCDGLLEVEYDYHGIREGVEKRDLSERRVISMWRYSEFLPLSHDEAVTLGEGFTPLVKAKNLGSHLGLKNLYLKLDFNCPTGSFKDRGSAMMVSRAKHDGCEEVTVDSSGNAAASIAGYSAKAGMRCYVFAPSYASVAKLVQSQVYGATVFAVEGSRRETYETAREAYQRLGWYYCGFQTNPYAMEGLKTLAYELCESFDWSAPDLVVFPVGSSSNLTGCWKGLRELNDIGWIPRLPSLVCVQSEGCAPISRAYKSGSKSILPVESPESIAEGLMITHPLKGELTLRILSETRGLAEVVNDEEILEAGELLAEEEGVFIEPSSAVSLAGVKKLADSGLIAEEEIVVCVLTGNGLKTREFYSKIVGKPIKVKPGIDDVIKILYRH